MVFWVIIIAIFEVITNRMKTIAVYKLVKFKEELMKIKPEVMRAKVDELIEKKKEEAITIAVAKAQAKAPGLLARIFV